MKQFFSAILFFVFAALPGFAQDRPMHGDRHRQDGDHQPFERIHAIKVAYITDKLHFTSEQSAQFWPIYDRYEQEVRRTRREFFEKYKNNKGNEDEHASKQFVDDDLDYQQEILNLKRKYNDDFIKVISQQQLAQLYKAEREFKMLLLKQLNDRRRNGGNGGGNWNRDNNVH